MGRINILSCFAFLVLSTRAVDAVGFGISAFIVNGRAAEDAAFPWQLSFQRREKGLWFHTCGATLIHERYAVTASHCVYNRYKKNEEGKYESYKIADMRVAAGANKLKPLDKDAEIYLVEGAITPFGLSAFFDVALLKLAVPANTSRDDIQAIPIANDTDVTSGRRCSVTGWGTVDRNDPKFTPTLRVASMRLLAHKDCLETGWRIAPFQTCASGVRRDATACFGDSGGPLSCELDDGTQALVGVSSFVYKRCGVSRPNVFVNLPVFRNWIRRLTLIDDL